MRRGTMILAAALIALAVIGIGAGAYNAGQRDGLDQQIETIETTTADGTDVVQVVGPADLDDRGFHGHGGFFPLGFLLFPLFVIGGFVLVGTLLRGGPGRHWRGPGGPGTWGSSGVDEGWRSRAETWHREMHERQGSAGGSPEPPPTPGATAASPA